MRDGQVGRVGRVGPVGPVGRARHLRRAGLALAALASLLGTAGCSGNSTTTPAATTPTVSRTTDSFTGTVVVGGSDFHSFPVAAAGTIDVTLTAAAPPAAIVMGISIGVPADGKCNAVAGGSTRTPAGTSVQLSGIASPGTLCVDVRDGGGQTAPVTYTVTVTHP
jgi:hypothetical protein